MKLNKAQRDYAVSRLNEKIREKRDAEMPKSVKSKKEDLSALYHLLNSCNVPLVSEKEFKEIWNIRSINEALIFPVNFDSEYENYQEKRKEIIEKYDTLKQQILDKLYLCDEAEEALALINSI